MKNTNQNNVMRNSLIGMVHIGKNNLNLDEQQYRTWLFENTGKTSCTNLTMIELESLVKLLRQSGALDQANFNSNTQRDSNRPTQKQWQKMEVLARSAGFGNVNTPHFIAWVKNITKCDHPRFLTKSKISNVIAGLIKIKKWKESRKARDEKANNN